MSLEALALALKGLSLEEIKALPVEQQEAIISAFPPGGPGKRWLPNPGPQLECYECRADETLFGGEPGGGKAVSQRTPIPTPAGWTTMGEVRVGDQVLDEKGMPCNVVAKTEPFFEPTYRVVFSDGAEVIAGERHEWVTSTRAERQRELKASDVWREKRRATRPPRGNGAKPWLAERNAERACSKGLPVAGIRTTKQIAETLIAGGGQRFNHAVAVAAALQLAEADLLIDPYVLGAWLGDGTSSAGSLAGIDEEVFAEVAASGYTVTRYVNPYLRGVRGLSTELKQLGVHCNKHIPIAYLRASFDQRLALLQGLMDTDGHCDLRGQCEIQLTRKELIDGVQELLLSLGIKVQMREGTATLNGRVIGPKWRLKFLTEHAAFRLPRKLIRQKRSGFRGTHDVRYIVSCERVPEVPVQCIQVDSPSHMYLCGREMIPTHNSQVLIGCALGPNHTRSLLLRRTNNEARKFVEEIEEVLGNREGYHSQTNDWRVDGKQIDIGGCQHEDDKQKYRGVPHDLIGFDELTAFSETQYKFITMWNRSTIPGQLCRVVGATNGPTDAEGMWVLKRWAAWLDPQHPYPAESGEVRYYYIDEEGREIEDTGPNEHVILGRTVRARSRTFIRSKLSDNPDLAETDYQSHLMAQDPEQRRTFALGDFGTMLEDKPYQAIPTSWVMAAVERWTAQPPVGVPMCAIGVDVAIGGKDDTILAPRYDAYFTKLIVMPRKATKGEVTGSEIAGFVTQHRLDGAKVVIDLGGGYGGDALAHLSRNHIDAVGYMGVKASVRRSIDGKHKFKNVRTEAYWRFHEALNPDQPGGSQVALPNDRVLIADLTAPTYKITANGIELQSKDELKAILGRSPDRGDAVVMAWWAGARMASDWNQWPASKGPGFQRTQVNQGRTPLSARR